MPPVFNRSAQPSGRQDPADTVTRHIDQQIGKELRALYNAVLEEPVPDRFLALLDQLDTALPPTSDDKLTEEKA